MKAARVHRFGPPEVITIEETATPLPGDDEVLVRVAACGVGPWDAWVRAGKSAIEQPLPLTLGADLSGTVTQLGSGVRGLSLGQPVFGVTNPRFTGAYADFAVASAAMVAPKPPGLDHRAAAGLPVVAATARQMVDDEARVVAGQRVLVHGAGGSVGSLAVQLAMACGATVVGTSPPGATDYVRSLGVERVVDGTAEDFRRDVAPAHAVIDTVGGATQGNLLAALAPGGILVSSVSQPDPALAAKLGVRGVFILVRVTRQALVDMGALAATAGSPCDSRRRCHSRRLASRTRCSRASHVGPSGRWSCSPSHFHRCEGFSAPCYTEFRARVSEPAGPRETALAHSASSVGPGMTLAAPSRSRNLSGREASSPPDDLVLHDCDVSRVTIECGLSHRRA